MKKTYGLIGYPVKHSFSPAMHNAAFKHLGLDAEYKLFEVKPDELKDFFSHFKERLCGANVTIPHKEAVFEYVDKKPEPVDSIGAINTIVLEDGLLVGHNTDIGGFTEALIEDLELSPGTNKAVVLGAGGASRAVTFGLMSLGIENIVLSDLDSKKAANLASDLNKEGCRAVAVQYDKKVVGELVLNSDLLVNATPCGMKKDDPELIDPRYLHKKLCVFDLIYNPEETPLIRTARKKGLKAANGLGMLLYQGVEAFELWTGKKAPIEIMHEALQKALKGL